MAPKSQSPSTEDALINLNNTLNKDQGIVNTSSAGRFLESPGSIDEQYRNYASTHLIQDDIDMFINDLVESLDDPEEDRSIPGYLVGPFGYGKTSTAGKIWHRLEQNENYVTTPPIYFDELQSIVDAVYGWLDYRLTSDDQLDELEEIYNRHLETNVEDIVDETDIEADDQEDIHDQLQQLVQTGEIDVTFTVDNLLSFLSESNTLVKEAGYDGLVVLADELQQFISNAPSDKKAYAQLRDIAKSIALGLREGDGLGLLFTMDDGLEGDLNVNADDVLARLSEQGVTIDLRNVYDREFPIRLWDSLAEKYQFEKQKYDVISEDALNALGQVCARGKPLSNGPRTVVDILTIGIDHYLNTENTFDALDLANSYYSGTVRYKGDHIKQGMTSAINADIVDNESRENFIKLCGVFPRGIPDKILEKFDLKDARDGVKNDLHGQHIITHEEGYTLKHLERDDEDRGIKDEIFTQFYQKYDTTEIHNDNAREVFQSQVLEEEVFEGTRGKTLNSWITQEEFSAHTGGVYKSVFTGSFDGDNYPERRLAILVGDDDEAVINLAKTVDDVDLILAFVADMRGEVDPYIDRVENDIAVLHLNFRTKLDDLPGGLQLLVDYMSPEDVNPHLLLSLYYFIQDWQGSNSINPNQESQLDYVKGNLIEQSVSNLFGPPLNQDSELGVDPDDRRTIQAQKVIPTLFSRIIQDIYPDYETLFVSDNYSTFLDDYEGLLISNDLELQISQKRGNRDITENKKRLAEAIGVSSVATAETRYRKVLSPLVDVQDWDGEERTIKLNLHPLEKKLKETIEDQNDDRLRYPEAYEIGAEDGYREEEVDWALRLLDAREYIDRYPDDSTPYVELDEVAIDYHEVSSRFDKVKNLFDKAKSLNSEDRITQGWPNADSIESELDSLREELDGANNEDIELLDRVLSDVSELEQQIESKLSQIKVAYVEKCKKLKDRLDTLSTASKPRGLQKSAEGANVSFHIHISDLQEELVSEYEDAQSDVSEAASDIQSLLNEDQSPSSDVVDRIKKLRQALDSAETAINSFENKKEEIENKADDYEAWVNLSKDMGDLREKMGKYIKNHDDPSKVESLKETLDKIMSEIMNEFQKSSGKADGVITNAGVYKKRLEKDIRSEYQDITDAEANDFNYRRNVLENTLERGTEGRGQIMQNLSPRKPAESRNNLSKQFANALHENRGGIGEIKENIESVRNKVDYSLMLNQVPNDPDNDPKDIFEELDRYEKQIDRISESITDLDVRDQISLPVNDEKSADFPKTDDELEISIDGDTIKIGSEMSSIRENVEETLGDVKRWQSITEVPPDLEYIHEELSSRQDQDIEDLLTTIGERQDTDAAELNLGEFFEDLRELFEENHISIKIASEHR